MADEMNPRNEEQQRRNGPAGSGQPDTGSLQGFRTTRRRVNEVPEEDLALQRDAFAEEAAEQARARRTGKRTSVKSGSRTRAKRSGQVKGTGTAGKKKSSRNQGGFLQSLGRLTGGKKSATRKKTSDTKASGQTGAAEDLRKTDRKAARKAALEARHARIRKLRVILIIIGALAAVLLIMTAVKAIHRRGSEARAKRAERKAAESAAGTVAVTGKEVLHLSFPRLKMATGSAAAAPDEMTVTEFNELLADLYGRGYVLVDIRSLTEKDDDGNYYIHEVEVPQGKTPLVISQHGLSYAQEDKDRGYATGIELTDEGNLTNLYLDANGGTRTGSCDVITCVDDFIAEHPDFSYQDARGVIALTGEDSVLGYADGTSAECQNVINKMFEEGWLFASGTAGGISYGSEMSLFEADAKLWQDTFAEAVGPTEIILLPDGADIGNRSPYSTDNQKYKLLAEQGFHYYCIDDASGMTWMQTGSGFVRQSMHEVDSYEQYLALMDNGLDAFVNTRDTERKAAETNVSSGEETDSSNTDNQTGTEENKYQEASDEYDEEGNLIVEHESAI
ncbi:MAG: hypothetical protein IJI10_04565 [Eubacterium sp.]|nr:hypothetical protein [Eubacterium sp.]